jgi:hypothetical protein
MAKTIARDRLQCQICKQNWTPKKNGYKPRRCVNLKCRSMRWDSAKYPTVKLPNGSEVVVRMASPPPFSKAVSA